MEEILVKEKPEVRLRAFRAIDEPETCEQFVNGHRDVLTSIGVTKVTSSKNDWTSNPAVFVIVAEALNSNKVYGGARVHVAGGTEPLPIEQATAMLDPLIHELVYEHARYGTGEICGLWNSQELAGYGIGTPLLIRTGIAISTQIGLQSLFALCAPYTVKPVLNCGMELEDSIGNKGTFYYPKLDLIATTMLLRDVTTLSKALDDDKAAIMEMRNNLNNLTINELKQKQIHIDFKLKINNLDRWDLAQTILSSQKEPLNHPGTKDPIFL